MIKITAEKLTVKDIMTRRVITIDKDKSILDAAKKMTRARVGTIIIMDGKKPIGIITTTDIIKKVVAKNLRPSEVKVIDIMSSPLKTAKPNDLIVDIVERIKEEKITKFPVVERNKLVGIITTTDIARIYPEVLFIEKYRPGRWRELKPGETMSGYCEICGNYSENLQLVNGLLVCEECRESMA